MSHAILVRLAGLLTCVAAIVSGLDAEAGWRSRGGCCATSCCSPCYSSCYVSSCYTPVCSSCVSYVDSCSSCCATSCSTGCYSSGCTVISTPVIISDCCASTTTAKPVVQTAAKPTGTPVKPVSTSAR